MIWGGLTHDFWILGACDTDFTSFSELNSFVKSLSAVDTVVFDSPKVALIPGWLKFSIHTATDIKDSLQQANLSLKGDQENKAQEVGLALFFFFCFCMCYEKNIKGFVPQKIIRSIFSTCSSPKNSSSCLPVKTLLGNWIVSEMKS